MRESVVDAVSDRIETFTKRFAFRSYGHRVEVLACAWRQFSPHFRLQAQFCPKTVSTIRHRLKPLWVYYFDYSHAQRSKYYRCQC